MLLLIPLLAPAALDLAKGPSRPHPIDQGSWITEDDYPAPALRAAEEGRVGYKLTVDANGRVTGCVVVTSSGSAVLDTHTCDLMRLRARFTPAADDRGEPIPSEYGSAVNWVIPAGRAWDVSNASTLDRWTIDLNIAPDGRVAGCTAVELTGTPADRTSLSPCARYASGSRYSDPMTRNGQPIAARVRISEVKETEFTAPTQVKMP